MSKSVSLTDIANSYVELYKSKAQIEAQMAPLADALKAAGPIDIVANGAVVKVIDVAGRRTTDWKSVVAAAQVPQSTVDRYTKTGAESKRIDVTVA